MTEASASNARGGVGRCGLAEGSKGPKSQLDSLQGTPPKVSGSGWTVHQRFSYGQMRGFSRVRLLFRAWCN